MSFENKSQDKTSASMAEYSILFNCCRIGSVNIPPPPNGDKKIKETITVDIVVVGGGNAGMFAAITAAEVGARTVLLEKKARCMTRSFFMGAINSSLQRKLGVKIDKEEVVEEICRYGGHLVDQRLVNLWADKSGEVLDWFTSIMESGGLQVIVETDIKTGYYKSFPIAHIAIVPGRESIGFRSGRPYGSAYYMPILVKKAKEVKVDIRCQTPMVQLVRKEKGRVDGVIARNSQGDYIKYYAKKGVILCTGGYGRNVDMLKKLCPTALYTCSNDAPVSNTGDGIQAAMRVGAAIDPIHSVMVFDRGLVPDGIKNGPPWKGGYWQMGSQPFLRVNLRGERFVNEDLPYDYCWNASLLEPGQMWWQVWDANWKKDIRRFHTTICARMEPHLNAPPRPELEVFEKEIIKMVGKGWIKKADTIEELGKKMSVPIDTFKATVARYNKMVKQGKDSDFGKPPFRLSVLIKPPYYAVKLSGVLLCTLNGLRINTKLQVLDTELNVIPGLYAAGNDSGSFFANNYPQLLGGLALGRTMTFGRLAGLIATEAGV